MEQIFDTDTLNSKISLFPGLHEISRNEIGRKTSLPQLFLTLVSETETLSCSSCQGQQRLSPRRIQVGGKNQEPSINTSTWDQVPAARLRAEPSVWGAELTMLINTYHFLVKSQTCNSPCLLFLEEVGHGCSSNIWCSRAENSLVGLCFTSCF